MSWKNITSVHQKSLLSSKSHICWKRVTSVYNGYRVYLKTITVEKDTSVLPKVTSSRKMNISKISPTYQNEGKRVIYFLFFFRTYKIFSSLDQYCVAFNFNNFAAYQKKYLPSGKDIQQTRGNYSRQKNITNSKTFQSVLSGIIILICISQ